MAWGASSRRLCLIPEPCTSQPGHGAPVPPHAPMDVDMNAAAPGRALCSSAAEPRCAAMSCSRGSLPPGHGCAACAGLPSSAPTRNRTDGLNEISLNYSRWGNREAAATLLNPTHEPAGTHGQWDRDAAEGHVPYTAPTVWGRGCSPSLLPSHILPAQGFPPHGRPPASCTDRFCWHQRHWEPGRARGSLHLPGSAPTPHACCLPACTARAESRTAGTP